MKIRKAFALFTTLIMLGSMIGVIPVGAQSGTGTTTQVPNSGTTSPITGEFVPSGGDATQLEFPAGDDDEGAEAYNGVIDRSLSDGPGKGASTNSGKKAKSNPTFNTGF